MARYFGGFRDRLKKRSKHLPVSEKDIDWVKVATTFSWSPAKRDYQWLEPEDYLSSFLNGNQADSEHESVFQGDGSMDAIGVEPFPHDTADEADAYTPEPPAPISYIPPFDFTPPGEHEEETPLFEDVVEEQPPVQAEDTLLRLRPAIDVQAELPMLEEYKLEIVSALQRRGRQIKMEEIILPGNLEQQLTAYHGKVGASVDSYELRARLQKFKQQLIDSHDQQSPVSSSLLRVDENILPSKPDNTSDREMDADYDSYILNSLNRLEASMQDVTVEENEALDEEKPFADEMPQVSPPSDEASDDDIDARKDYRRIEIENAPDETSPQQGSNDTLIEELPSNFADDSWLVLPIDTNKHNLQDEDLATPPGVEHASSQPEEEDAPDLAGLRADNDELLKALNTISSRFPQQDTGKKQHSKSLFRKKEVDDARESNQRNNRPINEEFGFADDELISSEKTEQDAIDAPVAHIEADDLDAFIPENEAIKADDTSLSDLLLQLRNERDDGMKVGSKPSSVDQQHPPTPVAETSEPIEFVSNQTVPAEKDVAQDTFTAIGPTVEEQAPEKNTPPATPEENSQVADLKRAKFIEDERKKLYSLIGKLEKDHTAGTAHSAKNQTSSIEQKPVEPMDSSPADAPNKAASKAPVVDEKEILGDQHAFSMLDASVISEVTEIVPDLQPEVLPNRGFKEVRLVDDTSSNDEFIPRTDSAIGESESDAFIQEDDTLLTFFEDPEKGAGAIQSADEMSAGNARQMESPLAPEAEKSDLAAEPEAELPTAVNATNVETNSIEKPLMVEVQEKETDEEAGAAFSKVGVQEVLPVSEPAERPAFEEQPEPFRSAKEDFVMSQPQTDQAPDKQEEILVEPVENQAPSKLKVSGVEEIDPVNNPDPATEMRVESNVPMPVEVDGEKEANPVLDKGLIEADELLSGEASLDAVIETLAFAAEDPIPVKRIARIYAEMQGVKLPTEKEMEATIDRINAHYEASGRAFRIKNWGGGIRMASHPQYARFIRALYEEHRPKKLSRTLMETLAIISYSQPTTKPEIDFVRGVDSDYAVRKLLEIGLIDIVGRSESIGRPLLYGTSERFLEQFGLSSLEALPKLREVEELLGDPAFKKERLHLLALEGMEEAAQAIDERNEAPEGDPPAIDKADSNEEPEQK